MASGPTELLEAVRSLTASTHTLARGLRWTRVFVTLNFVLLAVGAVLFFQVRDTQQEAARTRKEVLCPLYGIFLANYAPQDQPKEQLARYEANFDVIRAGATVLRCPPAP